MDKKILVYPDGCPVALDSHSGGYPVRALRSVDAQIWENEAQRERYLKMFKEMGFKKATLRVQVIVEE